MEIADRTADEIRAEMQITRQRVLHEATEVVIGARRYADWRYYPRQYPWAVLAAATVVGYAAVPRGRQVVASNVELLGESVRQGRLVSAPGTVVTRRSRLLETLLAAAGRVMLRAGAAYAGRRIACLMDRTGARIEETAA